MTDVSAFPMPRTCPLDPPEQLGRLRAEQPITRVRLWDGTTPWLVTRYDDVRAVLADPRFSADPARPGYPARSPAGKRRAGSVSFLQMDDPEHARYRRMLIGEFTMRRMERLRPLVTETGDGLLSAMAAGPRPVDLVKAFALPLPSMVICRLLGVPYADHDFFQQQSRTMLDTRADPGDAAGARRELARYLHELVLSQQDDPGDDLIGRLIEQRVRTGELTTRQVAAMAVLLLVAGHETTANMIALGTLSLLEHPEQARRLRDGDPAYVKGTVEELLRLLTITHTGRRRVAAEDVDLRGTVIRAGDGVIAAADAANRDPEIFADPDHLAPGRAANHHLAFGFGVHQCLGQQLARLELQIAYPALLRRFPGLKLATDAGRLRFRDEMPVYGVDTLPVTW